MHLAQAIPSLPSVSASQPDNLERKSNLQGAAGVFSPASQEFFIGQHSLPHFQFHVGKEEKRFLPSWFCGSMDATELAFTTIGSTHLSHQVCWHSPQSVPPTFCTRFAGIHLNRCHPPFGDFAGFLSGSDLHQRIAGTTIGATHLSHPSFGKFAAIGAGGDRPQTNASYRIAFISGRIATWAPHKGR